jgi:hypothetical protein
MEDDAIQMLATTWVTCICSSSKFESEILERLTRAKNLDRDQWCQLLYAFCKAKHDSTAFYLMLRGTCEPAEWQPVFTYTHSYIRLEDALEGSLRRNKLVDAWLIARSIDPKIQWTLLEKLAAEKGTENIINGIQASTVSTIEKLAAAFTLVSIQETVLSSPDHYELPSELSLLIQEWDAENSLRKRRAFKVRPEAITYLCERSSQPVEESNECDIQEHLEETLLASFYWKGVMKPYIKKTDRKREEFYDIFFSQSMHDIPDEWSLADREKSHGRGLGKSKAVAFKQFLNATFQRSTVAGIWNSNDLHKSLEYSEEESMKPCVIHLPLKQSRKQFEIITA